MGFDSLPDVAGPGLITVLGLGLGAGLVVSVAVVFVEAVVLGGVPRLGGFGAPLGQPAALATLGAVAAAAGLGYWIIGRRSAAHPA